MFTMITLEDISMQDFKSFLAIKNSKVYHLISDGAVRASGLDNDVYYFILNNYSELLKKYENKELNVKQ